MSVRSIGLGFAGLLAFGWGCADSATSSGNPAASAGAAGMPAMPRPPVTPSTTGSGAVGQPATPAPVAPPPTAVAMAGTSGMTPMSGAAGDAAPVPAADDDGANVTCPEPSSRGAGVHTEMMMHDGNNRQYYLMIPPQYDGTKAVPIIFDFHGLAGSSDMRGGSQAAISGWREKGMEEGFITVHPTGIGAAWNGGSCCGGTNDDVGFTKAMLETISKEFCINPKRVYASGLSNGGAMSHRLACEAADIFAATAPVSMGGLTSCMPSRPITIVEFRGRRDGTVAYGGGGFRAAEADFTAWAMVNGCEGEPVENMPEVEGLSNPMEGCRTYDKCKDGVTVTLCSPNSDHVLYNQPGPETQPASAVADLTWPIFKAHPLP
jgi:polyhydroxybutyrate depolymerase